MQMTGLHFHFLVLCICLKARHRERVRENMLIPCSNGLGSFEWVESYLKASNLILVSCMCVMDPIHPLLLLQAHLQGAGLKIEPTGVKPVLFELPESHMQVDLLGLNASPGFHYFKWLNHILHVFTCISIQITLFVHLC